MLKLNVRSWALLLRLLHPWFLIVSVIALLLDHVMIAGTASVKLAIQDMLAPTPQSTTSRLQFRSLTKLILSVPP